MRTNRNLPGLLVDFPSVVNTFFTDDFAKPLTSLAGTKRPAVNIAQDTDSYGIELIAPGFEKEHFTIRVEQNQLIVEGTHKAEAEESATQYTHREFHVSGFKRVFNLPENEINDEKITANYVNGILKIVLPKKEEAKPKAPKIIAIH